MGSLKFLSLNISLSRFIPFPNTESIARHVNSAQFDDHDTFLSPSCLRGSPKTSKKAHILTKSLFPAYSKEQIKGNQYICIQVGLVLTFWQVTVSDKWISQMHISKHLKFRDFYKLSSFLSRRRDIPAETSEILRTTMEGARISLFC